MLFSWLILACASLTLGARLGARETHCGKCSKKAQLSQASGFCSSFESIGVKTVTQYPSTTTKPNDCCPLCAANSPQTAPTTTKTTPPITASVTQPACFGSGTGLAQKSKACACLSLTSKTTTVTAATPLTLTGPFQLSELDGAPSPDRYLADVQNKGTTFVQMANKTLATNYYLDQDGRLFSQGDFDFPFTLPEGAAAGSINPVNKQNNVLSPTSEEPLTCSIMDFGCELLCTAAGYTANDYLACHTTWNMKRESSTAGKVSRREKCSPFGLMAARTTPTP